MQQAKQQVNHTLRTPHNPASEEEQESLPAHAQLHLCTSLAVPLEEPQLAGTQQQQAEGRAQVVACARPRPRQLRVRPWLCILKTSGVFYDFP